MENVFWRITGDVDGSLPGFVKDVYDRETQDLLDLFNASWEDRDLSGILIYADRYLNYVTGKDFVLCSESIKSLVIIARRLWLLAISEFLCCEDMKLKFLHSEAVLDDLKHIELHNRKITLQKKIRSLQILSSILQSLRNSLHSVWERDSEKVHEDMSGNLDFIKLEVILALYEDHFGEDYKSPAKTSVARRKVWMNCIVRISALMRHIWLFRDDLGSMLVEHILGENSATDPMYNDIFYKFRLLLLLCPNITIHRHLVNGDLFRWWDLVNGEAVPSWNAMMFHLLFRGVKFGWATGVSFYPSLLNKFPFLFNLLYSAFGIPKRVTLAKYKTSVPGEFTVLLEKSLNIFKKFAKTLALLILPIFSTYDTKIDDIDKIDLRDYITALVNVIYPYIHPSNAGKWSVNIASFSKHFVSAYSRRICRERASNSLSRAECGMRLDGTGKHISYRLNKDDDAFIVDLFYTLALQGMYSKNVQVAYAYEDVIKRLCHMQPDRLLNMVIEHLLSTCDSLTEPHQVLGALRIFSQLCPLIIKYAPIALLPILEIGLKGIDASDPFKTGQTLTLLSVIFSSIPCMDLSDVELSDDEKLRLVRIFYLGNRFTENLSYQKSLEVLNIHNNGSYLNLRDFLFTVDTTEEKQSVKQYFGEESPYYLREMKNLECTSDLDDAIMYLDVILAQRRYVTQSFPIWCQNWFSVVLQLAEQSSIPNINTDSFMNAVDMGTFILLRSALVTILSQTDIYTFKEISERFSKWIVDNASRKDSLKHMTAIATSISCANPQLALDIVFKRVFHTFKCEVDKCDHDVYPRQMEADRLIWYTACFCGIFRRGHKLIIPHIEDVMFILGVGFKHKSKLAFKYSGKLLQRCIDTLLGVCFTDACCSPNFSRMGNSHGLLLWDLPWFVRGIDLTKDQYYLGKSTLVEWHIANDEEFRAANCLIKYAVDCILNLADGMLCDLYVPKFLDGTENNLDFNAEVTTNFNRINRICILCKCLLKGLKNFSVDDRKVQLHGLPLVMPVEFTQALEAQFFVRSVITSMIAKYGKSLETEEDLLVTNVLRKLLKLIDIYMVRNALIKDFYGSYEMPTVARSLKQESNVGQTITANKGMFHWLSFYYGVHRKSYWQDLPRVSWLSILHERYQERLNLRKFGHECVSDRRVMLDLILNCATCHYKEVSTRAQHLLKGAAAVHRRVKSDIVEFILERCLKLLQESDSKLQLVESLEMLPECLNMSLIKQTVTRGYLFSKYIEVIFSVISKAPNKDSPMNKYDNLFLAFLNSKETCTPTEAMVDSMKQILDSLLEQGPDKSKSVLHWRFQLYSTATLVSFRHFIPDNYFEKYIEWLMEASDSTSKHASTVTIALFGLLQLFCNNHLSAQVSDSMRNTLCDGKIVKRLLNAVCAVNHDSVKQTNTSCSPKISSVASSIVVSVTKLEKSLLRNRIPPNSNLLSIPNFIFSFHYFLFLLNHGGVEVIGPAIGVLEDLANTPPSFPENHIGFAEISGGLMKATIVVEEYVRKCVWELLQPTMKKELEGIVQDRILDFMDSFRLVFNDYTEKPSGAYIPIFNLSIGLEKPLNLSEIHECSIFDYAINRSSGSSLYITKQLKLCQAVLQQVFCSNSAFLDSLLIALLNENALFNDSQQIRDEVGCLCSMIVSICGANDSLKAYASKVLESIAISLNKLDMDLPPSNENYSGIKGLLSVIGLLFSPFISTINLDHSYVSRFLEFALRLTKHQNLNVNELANKAICNITMSPYHVNDCKDSIDALESALVKMSKSSSYKIKLNTIYAAEMMQRNLCMYIRKKSIVRSLLNIYISALEDTQIRDAAKDSLAAIAVSADDNTHLELTERFYSLVKNNTDAESASAGVFGLSALISIAPYHVPNWMPHTLTTLASCAGSRFPDSVRKTVQRTLQEFFKSHMDAWSQIHVHKFTKQQLELLEMYKGCPAYFN